MCHYTLFNREGSVYNMDLTHSDHQNIYLDAPYMEAYIPMYYFEKSGFAEDKGEILSVFGIMVTRFFENDKVIAEKTLCVPSMIDMYCTDYENREVELPRYGTIPCKVMKYYQGQKIMSANIIQDSGNAITMLDFIIAGKLPVLLPYKSIIEVWYKNQHLNGTDFGVPSFILELILSVAYRSQTDPTKKFCEEIGQPGSTLSEFDYRCVSVRQICQYSSTFQSLTFEDIDAMITSSLNRTRRGIKDEPTPVENVIKM